MSVVLINKGLSSVRYIGNYLSIQQLQNLVALSTSHAPHWITFWKSFVEICDWIICQNVHIDWLFIYLLIFAFPHSVVYLEGMLCQIDMKPNEMGNNWMVRQLTTRPRDGATTWSTTRLGASQYDICVTGPLWGEFTGHPSLVAKSGGFFTTWPKPFSTL